MFAQELTLSFGILKELNNPMEKCLSLCYTAFLTQTLMQVYREVKLALLQKAG